MHLCQQPQEHAEAAPRPRKAQQLLVHKKRERTTEYKQHLSLKAHYKWLSKLWVKKHDDDSEDKE
jgi:hypothetical protein